MHKKSSNGKADFTIYYINGKYFGTLVARFLNQITLIGHLLTVILQKHKNRQTC